MSMTVKTDEKISIIVPYFNEEPYLRRCVNSLTSQTYQELEILLVDDGSEDGSPQIARELADADPRISCLSLPHRGVAAARNAGLAAASGAQVLFVDADDWMRRDMISRMHQVMRDTQADIVTCDLTHTDGQEKTEEAVVTQAPAPEICSQEEYLRLFFRIHSNEWVHFPVAKLYKKELLPQPLYPVGIRVGEDVPGTYLAVIGAKKIARIREVGYFYFNNPQSATSCFSDRNFDLIAAWDMTVQAAEGREPDHSYAKLNRHRADFGILLRMTTEVPAAEIREKYGPQREKLLRSLREGRGELLRSPIVFSRKVLIFILCYMYPLFAFFGDLYARWYRFRGRNVEVARRKL